MILTAKWVSPVSQPPIPAGAIRIAGERITAVGRRDALEHPGAEVVDLGDAVITPGLVNPHTHLELTCYTGQIPPNDFWTWVQALVRLRAAPGQMEREAAGVAAGAWQSLRAGVTCVGDISRRNVHWQVLKQIPIRKVCFVELLSLADHPPRNLAELEAGLDAVEEDNLLRAGITPHTPFTVPESDLRGAVELAARRRRPWCTHWAETLEERAFVSGASASLHPFLDALLAQCGVNAPKISPVAYLRKCTADLPPGLLAHYNYVDPGEAEQLAATGHHVVYCPRAHHYFGHAPHPFQTLTAAGVPLALGTDSAASNTDVNLLREAQFVLSELDNPPTPRELLEMITVQAAAALGLDAEVGTLAAGKQADVAAFPCSSAADPLEQLIATAPAPIGVWVAGRRVV